ncbi:MAG: hypothetical protein JO091_10705 [Acidobacteriaceae bacterium]|nr:hypothetical protein [Acidobacteriaceae bacterium]
MTRRPRNVQNPQQFAFDARNSAASDDGRNVDPALGTLTGEAATQATLATKKDIVLHSQSFPYVPSLQSWDNPTYYDHPMLKQPVWIWSIPMYMYVGGVAGVGATFGAAAQVMAPRAMRSLIVRSRWSRQSGAPSAPRCSSMISGARSGF